MKFATNKKVWNTLLVTCSLAVLGASLYFIASNALERWQLAKGATLPQDAAGSSLQTSDHDEPWGPDNPPSPENFKPMLVLEEQSAITDCNVVPADQAEGKVDPDELVLGVVVAGEARAYPINTMTGPAREIFNDELGGRPIAATW